jgi:hypothetical protein
MELYLADGRPLIPADPRSGATERKVTRLQIIGARSRRRRAFILQQHDEQAESYSQDHDRQDDDDRADGIGGDDWH